MAKNTNTAAVSTSTTSAPAAEQKKDGIFVQMLNATLSATEMVLAEKTGKLALDLLLQDGSGDCVRLQPFRLQRRHEHLRCGRCHAGEVQRRSHP